MTNDEPARRLAAVKAELSRAAQIAGRDPAAVTLVAVSKRQPMEAIAPLIAAGHRVFGENQVQEAVAKWSDVRAERADLRLHCIGRLQSNKAAEAVSLFDAIHSLDRVSLVTALARAIDAAGRAPQMFAQVNIGGEPQKGGVAVADLPMLLEACRGAGLSVAGLMAIPPATVEPAPYFALLAKLAREHDLPLLSMGMSGDAATAVTLGATHVRIGTALFGQRA